MADSLIEQNEIFEAVYRAVQSPFHHARLLLEVLPGRLLHLLVAQHPHPVLNNHLAELHRGSSFQVDEIDHNLSFLLFSVQRQGLRAKQDKR